MVQARQINAEGNVDELPGTFAFGNEEVGYQLFANGQRVTPVEGYEVPYSQTEAKLQLQQIINEEDLLDIDAAIGGARFKGAVDESLPGGNNYREIVYTWKNAPTEHRVSDHFDEANQISHALVRDRKLADGSSSLHVDELQSDLHTQGKQDGYMTAPQQRKKVFEDLDDFLKDKENYYAAFKDGKEGIRDRVTQEFISFTDIDYISQYAKQEGRTRFGSDRADELVKYMGKDLDRLAEIVKPVSKEGTVPNYPFKGDDWYKMSLKQLLKDAVEEGKDTLSVSGSAPMVARYSDKYEKFYKSLYDQKIPSAMKTLANTYGGKFEKGKLDYEDTFNPLIGENADVRLQENFVNRYETPENEDMALSDILSKTLEPGLEANIIRITPEMKQKILEEGLPSFALGGSVNNFIAPEDINIFA